VYSNTGTALWKRVQYDFQKVVTLLNEEKQFSQWFNITYKGPSLRINVYENKSMYEDNLTRWYSFDITVGVESTTKEGTVQFITYKLHYHNNEQQWRIKFSETETQIFKHLEKYGESQMKALRILKVVRDWSPELKRIRSFVLKLILFHELNKPALDWSDGALADRVLDMASVLIEVLEKIYLPNVFDPSCNEAFPTIMAWDDDRIMKIVAYMRHLIGEDGQGEQFKAVVQNIVANLSHSL
jgi:DUF438 domain-containing protein